MFSLSRMVVSQGFIYCNASWMFVRVLSHSVVSDSLQSHGLQLARLLCPWNFLSKNTGMGCRLLLQGIFPMQGSNPCLLHLLHQQADIYIYICHVLFARRDFHLMHYSTKDKIFILEGNADSLVCSNTVLENASFIG